MEIRKGIVISRINDEGLIYDTIHGNYYKLNDTACFIVEMIFKEKNVTISSLIDSMCQEYDVNAETVEEDILSIINSLEDDGIIIK